MLLGRDSITAQKPLRLEQLRLRIDILVQMDRPRRTDDFIPFEKGVSPHSGTVLLDLSYGERGGSQSERLLDGCFDDRQGRRVKEVEHVSGFCCDIR